MAKYNVHKSLGWASSSSATVKDGWKSAPALYRSCRLELFFFSSYKYLPVYSPPEMITISRLPFNDDDQVEM
jgi:hypothetical protein